MNEYFVDLHIHIGRTYKGKAVKITASRNLTFLNILEAAVHTKGMNMISIIDMHSPQVIEEVEEYLANGKIETLEQGGLRYNELTVIPGCEVELRFGELACTAHFLAYFPNLARMKEFSSWLSTKCKNIHLSTQRVYATMEELQGIVDENEGILIPAHVFTPFKSVYGNCTNSLSKILDISKIPAVELGLSSDSDMADCISELHNKTFVTNSDAHSLAKIGREYQKMQMQECSFSELYKVLWRLEDRRVTTNYGLNPKLGKYHLTRCASCSELVRDEHSEHCPYCGHKQLVKGVANRLNEIADLTCANHPSHRPPYIHQVPLEFIPGVGPRKLKLLLEHFHTEMNVLHHATEDQLTPVVGESIAQLIMKNRAGLVHIAEGGGGKYGKVVTEVTH